MQCEYCKAEFATKGNLKFHQKTAKYCLNMREDKDKVTENVDNFKCDFCDLRFSRKSSLQSHLNNCKSKDFYQLKTEVEKLREENQKFIEKDNYCKHLEQKNNHLLERLDEYKLEIQDLKNQLKQFTTIALEKTGNNLNTINYSQNNNQNNQQHIKNIDNRTINMIPFNLTPEGIRETLESKFNEKYLMKGQKGVAEFMIENVLVTGENDDKKFLMKCTDPSRKMFITLDQQGKISKDVNAENLTNIISGPVKEVTHKIYQDIQDRFFQMYENVGNELEDGDKEKEDLALENVRLDHATTKVCEISRLKNNNTEFVKNLISPLTV